MNADKRRSRNPFAPLRLCVSLSLLLCLSGCAEQTSVLSPQSSESAPSAKSADQVNPVNPVHSTVWVRSEADLRAAAWASRLGDVNLVFDSTITVTGTVTFPQSESIVRLVGTTPLAGINFAMRFDGDWSTLKPANGIEFRCRQAIVHGMRFTGFEFSGSVLKAHGCQLLSVSDSIFANIGRIQYPHRADPPLTASNTIYNSCINTHSMPGHVSIVNCRFNRCIHNNHRWSHVLYLSADSVLVTGNTFSDCGNVFSVGGASVHLLGNRIIDPHEQLHPTAGRELPPYLAGLGPGNAAFAFNQISGDHYRPITGQPNPATHWIDFNDYSAMRYTGQWAANTAQGFYILWPNWLQMGFDVHSKPPTDLGVRMPE